MNATSEYGHQVRELDPIRNLSYDLKQKYRGVADQLDARMLNAIKIFSDMCRKCIVEDLVSHQSKTRFLEVWHTGANMLSAFQNWGSAVSSTRIGLFIQDELSTSPKLLKETEQHFVNFMKYLAKRWFLPSPQDESRGVLYERIAALRPVEQNKRLQALMEKNNEGTISPEEYAELSRLNEFFDTLQAIIDDAITSTRSEQSAVVIEAELSQYGQACAGFDPLRPDARAEVARRWGRGVVLFDTLQSAGTYLSELPRLRAALTELATLWLQPRSAGEPRDRIIDRIAALKVSELNDRLRELTPRNTEGTLTPEERTEFERLHDRLDFFQDALSTAIQALSPGGS